MTPPERDARKKAYDIARQRAFKALREAHPDRHRELYDELLRGVELPPREQRAARNRIRVKFYGKALHQLRQEHADEFAAFLAEECKGLPPRLPARQPPACGTIGGYSRHRRLGESACEDCRASNSAYHRTHEPSVVSTRARQIALSRLRQTHPGRFRQLLADQVAEAEAKNLSRTRQSARQRALTRLAQEYRVLYQKLYAQAKEQVVAQRAAAASASDSGSAR